MPSIITHFKLIAESRLQLQKKKDISPFTRTLESLFSEPEFLGAAFLGSLGPDIFDYLSLARTRDYLGTPGSSYLHSRGVAASLSYLSDLTLKITDFTTEWAAMQRAYFYGYVSHLITDQIFNPFMFYWTGFPRPGSSRTPAYYREQLLLFEYNLDNYFQYYHDQSESYTLITDCLSKTSVRDGFNKLMPPLYALIAGINTLPTTGNDRSIFSSPGPLGGLQQKIFSVLLQQLVPLIGTIHKFKTNRSPVRSRILKSRWIRKILSPDFTTLYPEPRRLNKHILNLHRERWYYPAGGSGLHYESVEDLIKLAREKIVVVWELLDSYLFGHGPKLETILQDVKLDCYTGERAKGPELMTVCNEYRIRF
jgi:hypothetical protein